MLVSIGWIGSVRRPASISQLARASDNFTQMCLQTLCWHMKFSPLRHVWRKTCLSGSWTARTANSFPTAQRRKNVAAMRLLPKTARLNTMTRTNEWVLLCLIWKHPDINNLLCLSREAIIWVCMHWWIKSLVMSTKQYRNIILSQRQLTAYVNKFIALILVGLGRVRRPSINITLDESFR